MPELLEAQNPIFVEDESRRVSKARGGLNRFRLSLYLSDPFFKKPRHFEIRSNEVDFRALEAQNPIFVEDESKRVSKARGRLK
ncbi:hypothetical protein CEXT_4991 [Caerostris extrusa]|uniref:Uncharacterized protein n=1 Tax=Caerostris extrusa TaxID=172846 RepID=A0AAV4VSN5_CAEEX|nr:hypothetical protein CEXT_4991 [Caerostris extrusa]